MPTNLPAEAKHKWNEVSLAKNPKQKLRLLQEFLSLVPKHKGTAKLRAQVKRQMSILRREIEESRRRKAGRCGPKFFIEKEGAAQIVILGPTNVGRSSLLASTTNAKVTISDYPFTTQMPVPGMFQREDIQFQLVEAPALREGSADGQAFGLQTLGLARNADGLILMVDSTCNPDKQLQLILAELDKAKILVRKPRIKVEIERKHMGFGLRIHVLGRLLDCNMEQIKRLLKSYRISDAIVRIHGEARLDDIEEAIFETAVYRPTVVLTNKVDVAKLNDAELAALKSMLGHQVKVLPVSCKTGEGLERLGAVLFEALGIIRVYTKEPNAKKPSPKPFILKKGATISNLAKQIHSDFYKHFSYAKVWSKRLPFSPQKVGLSFPLEDGDIVEIHTK